MKRSVGCARRVRRRGAHGSGARRERRPAGRERVQPPGGAAHRGRPGGGQHGRGKRLREPGPAGHVTIIANYYLFQDPAGGPNYFRFDPTVRYELATTATRSRMYRFRFSTTVGNGKHVPLQHRPGHVAERPGPERQADVHGHAGDIVRLRRARASARPFASRRRTSGRGRTRSTTRCRPMTSVGAEGVHGPTGRPVLRRPGLDLRPRRAAPVQRGTPDPAREAGRRGRRSQLQRVLDRAPGAQDRPRSCAHGGRDEIGVYASASRQAVRVLERRRHGGHLGRLVQVSRSGTCSSTRWSSQSARATGGTPPIRPTTRSSWGGCTRARSSPASSTCCTRAARHADRGRNDLVAVLLTGVPWLNFTGDTKADLRGAEHRHRAGEEALDPLGALAGDLQGFPNGRRLADDVTDIEIRATACGYGQILAGALGLCNFTPNDTLADGVDKNRGNFPSTFPYVAPPNQGYEHTGHR